MNRVAAGAVVRRTCLVVVAPTLATNAWADDATERCKRIGPGGDRRIASLLTGIPDVTVYHMTSDACLPRPRHPLKPSEYDRTRIIHPYPRLPQ